MDKWSFVLTKLDREPIAEITDATDRKYVANLSKPSTASFKIRKDNPLAEEFFAEEDRLLKVYQGNTLRFFGPVLTADFGMTEGQPATINVSAVDPAWYFSRRLVGLAEKGTAYSGDKGNMVMQMLNATNVIFSTRVEISADLSGSTGAYTAGPYKPLLTSIQELAHGIDGFDWYIEPYDGGETGPSGDQRLGIMRLAAIVGSEKPNAVFEYGTGHRNIRTIGFLRDIQTNVNVAWQISDQGLEPSAENPTPVVVAFDEASYAARKQRFEEVVDLSGVNNVALRQAWVEENVRVRKTPRRVLSMTSDIDDGTGRVPQFGSDYWLGDVVPARAVIENRFAMFNGLARVYSVEVSLNDAGTAMVTPILVEDAE